MQVFISHSDSDSPLAARVSKALRKAGLRVWDPEVHILPGDNWPAEVGRALEESDAMVVLLTPNSVSSPHVKAEMAYALGSKSYRNRLIPVAVGGREQLPRSEIPWIIRKLPWVDLPNPDIGDPEVKPIADALLGHA